MSLPDERRFLAISFIIGFDFTQQALQEKRAWHRTIFLLYIRNVASEVAGEIHAKHAHLSFMLFKVKICSINFMQA